MNIHCLFLPYLEEVTGTPIRLSQLSWDWEGDGTRTRMREDEDDGEEDLGPRVVEAEQNRREWKRKRNGKVILRRECKFIIDHSWITKSRWTVNGLRCRIRNRRRTLRFANKYRFAPTTQQPQSRLLDDPQPRNRRAASYRPPPKKEHTSTTTPSTPILFG